MRHGDYQFDVDATVVLFLHVIEQYFEATGRSMADYLEVLPIEPLFQVVEQDGKRFEISTSPEKTGRIFAGFSAEDGEGWGRFSRAAETGMAQVMSALFTTPMPGLRRPPHTLLDRSRVHQPHLVRRLRARP